MSQKPRDKSWGKFSSCFGRSQENWEIARAEAKQTGERRGDNLALNLHTALQLHVRQRNCKINVADVKVQIAAAGAYRYPEAVSCSEGDRQATTLFQSPTLIVKVRSPGTERKERGEKLQEYRQLASFQEYILIDSSKVCVEFYRRGEGRMWLYSAYGPSDIAELSCLNFSCPAELIFEEVRLEQES